MSRGQQITQHEAWALVAFADRLNKGQYVKFPEFDQETGKVSIQPNRDIIKAELALGMVHVTDEDRAFGEKMYDHFQGLAFTAISQRLGDYDQKIMNLIGKETLPAGLSMVYLAPMASRYRREIDREEKNEILEQIGITSTHQGMVGSPFQGKMVIVSKFAGKIFTGSVIKATDGNNFYFWTSSKTVDVWPEAPNPFNVIAVVKAHGHTREGYAETRLTRVKITE
jgi:hypothetical protein